MNNKIPVRQFAEKLANECGITSEEAQQFVKVYFEKVIERLREEENVEIPGLGNFSLTHNLENPVSFAPDADAAAEINSPFEMFEPTELPEGVSEDDLSEEIPVEDEAAPEAVAAPVAEPEDVEQREELPAVEQVEEKEEIVEELLHQEPEEPLKVEAVPEPEIETPQETSVVADENRVVTLEENKYSGYIPEDEEEYVEHEPVAKKGLSFGLGFLIGLLTGLIVGAVVLYIYAMCYVNTPIGVE